MTDETLAKVYFQIEPGEWHGRPSETLWAEPVAGSKSGTVYRLRNSPFFVRNVSFLDTVRVAPRDDEPGLQFAGVVEHSGHSTYRLLVPPDSPAFETYWKRLEALGCTYESASMDTGFGPKVLYTVDIPAATDVYAAYPILEEGEKHGVWMFQEGHVGHPLKR
jgi:hypothetical protein